MSNEERRTIAAAGISTCGDPDKAALKVIEREEPKILCDQLPAYKEHFEGKSPEVPSETRATDEPDTDAPPKEEVQSGPDGNISGGDV